MKCVICKGGKIIEINDQTEVCYNCDGSGEVGAKDDINRLNQRSKTKS